MSNETAAQEERDFDREFMDKFLQLKALVVSDKGIVDRLLAATHRYTPGHSQPSNADLEALDDATSYLERAIRCVEDIFPVEAEFDSQAPLTPSG